MVLSYSLLSIQNIIRCEYHNCFPYLELPTPNNESDTPLSLGQIPLNILIGSKTDRDIPIGVDAVHDIGEQHFLKSKFDIVLKNQIEFDPHN